MTAILQDRTFLPTRALAGRRRVSRDARGWAALAVSGLHWAALAVAALASAAAGGAVCFGWG